MRNQPSQISLNPCSELLVPRLCCSPLWCCWRMENPGGCSRQREAMHSSWWMLIHAAAVAELAAHLGAVIQQDRTLPSPAQVISGQIHPSRIPKSFLQCPRSAGTPLPWGTVPAGTWDFTALVLWDLWFSGIFGALVWGPGNRKFWVEEAPGLARVGCEVSWKKNNLGWQLQKADLG